MDIIFEKKDPRDKKEREREEEEGEQRKVYSIKEERWIKGKHAKKEKTCENSGNIMKIWRKRIMIR